MELLDASDVQNVALDRLSFPVVADQKELFWATDLDILGAQVVRTQGSDNLRVTA